MSRRTVLVHAGVADPGMWDGFELPGELRRHHLEDDLADTVAGDRVALVGASYGGLVCLDFAARHPELVTAIVLLDAPHPDHEESDDLLAYAEEEERLLEEGRLEEATDLNVSYWKIPGRLRPMVRRSLEFDIRGVDEVDLSAVRAPVLVVVGEHDNPDFREMGERLARELPNAELVVIPGAGHLPSVERPDATLEAVARFLA
ncbi:MAG TPA: alpha/beta hydrolase [Thermoleophilaceae bacterium]|nr:alpha/beta hydrolase [Thermoleophilaceae bacterium]